MAKIETCLDCVYSYWDPCQIPWCLSVGYPVRPMCANYPDSPGRMQVLGNGRVCRNYRPGSRRPYERGARECPPGSAKRRTPNARRKGGNVDAGRSRRGDHDTQ